MRRVNSTRRFSSIRLQFNLTIQLNPTSVSAARRSAECAFPFVVRRTLRNELNRRVGLDRRTEWNHLTELTDISTELARVCVYIDIHFYYVYIFFNIFIK